MTYTRISADSHIDLCWLPEDLFTSNAPSDLRPRMPYVKFFPDGRKWVTDRGAKFGLVNGFGPTGRPYVPGTDERADRFATTGFFEDAANGKQRVTDPALRLLDMDRDGIDAEVIYGILAGTTLMNDPEAASVMLRIYNDWLVEFCRYDPTRFIGLGCLPFDDLEAAASEVYRMAEAGLRGVELSTSGTMEPLFNASYDKMWHALDETGLPVHFHAFPNVRGGMFAKWSDNPAAAFTAVVNFPLGLADILVAIMGANVFERFPNVLCVFGESGAGWIPYTLGRMDYEWKQIGKEWGLKKSPSEYYRERCKATFQYDTPGIALREMMGVETLMWGSDYPHADGIFPDSTEYIERYFGQIPESERELITCGNAKSFYGLSETG
jgi:uncharacterized protein